MIPQTFYILLNDDTEQDSYYHANQLGEISLNTFHTHEGYAVLIRLIEEFPHKLKDVKIIDSQKTSYSIEEFLDTIKPYKIK